jgi:hypothetical protein
MTDPGDFASWCAGNIELRSEDEATGDARFAIARHCARIWHEMKATGHTSRVALDPIRIGAAALPWVTLIDVIDGGADYRWRLSGEQAIETMGLRLTGRRLSGVECEMIGGEAVAFRNVVDRVVASGTAVFYETGYLSLSGRLKQTYGGVFPLWNEVRANALPDCLLSAFETHRIDEPDPPAAPPAKPT